MTNRLEWLHVNRNGVIINGVFAYNTKVSESSRIYFRGYRLRAISTWDDKADAKGCKNAVFLEVHGVLTPVVKFRENMRNGYVTLQDLERCYCTGLLELEVSSIYERVKRALVAEEKAEAEA
jgi:hypothetical protein